MEGVPLEGAKVVLLDEDRQTFPEKEAWTDDQGEYCLGGIPLERDFTVHVTYHDLETEEPFHTGKTGGRCGSIFCTEVNPFFSCSPPDDYEPNNTCVAAGLADLPFHEPALGLCPPGDVDFYRVEVGQDNMNLMAEVRPSPGSRYLYKRIGLFDSDCVQLSSDAGSSAEITYPLQEAGTYFVAVSSGYDYSFVGEHDEYGEYELEIRTIASACVNFVVQENGEPLAGAEVRGSSYPYTSCITDAAGSCCLGAYEGMEKRFYVYHPFTYDYLETPVTPSGSGTCEDGGCEPVTVDFDYTCVNGTVTRNEEPVSGAEVRGPYDTHTTGPDGAYCLRAPKDQDVPVEVTDPVLCSYHPGVAETGPEDGSCVEGGCAPLPFQLDGLTCVTLTFTRDGNPVEGVVLYPPSGCDNSLISGPDGKVCFPAPAEKSISGQVRDPLFRTYVPFSVETETGGSCAAGGCREVEVQLTGVTCVSGVVLWQDGQPVEGVRVRGPAGETLTAPDGSYCIQAPKDTLQVELGFWDRVYSQERTRYADTGDSGSCEEGGCTPLNVVFPATACISGTLTREDGNPPMGAEVCLGYWYWGELCVEPDEEGQYCLRAPAEEDYVYMYVRDKVTGHEENRYLSTGLAGSCAGGVCTTADFTLPGVSCVSGTVTREGVPEEGADVCLDSYYMSYCVSTDPSGEYCLPAPVQSHVRIEVRDPALSGDEPYGYVDTGPSASCEDGDCVTLDLQLRGATCLSGIVLEGGEPLTDAEVWNEFGRLFTGEDGRYCLPALSNEDRWIRCGHPLDGSEILRYPVTNADGRCDTGDCKTQNFTFDLKKR